MKQDNRPTIAWTPVKLKRFEQAYADTAGFENDYVFTFDGHEFVKSYAKYLIEYLKGEFA